MRSWSRWCLGLLSLECLAGAEWYLLNSRIWLLAAIASILTSCRPKAMAPYLRGLSVQLLREVLWKKIALFSWQPGKPHGRETWQPASLTVRDPKQQQNPWESTQDLKHSLSHANIWSDIPPLLSCALVTHLWYNVGGCEWCNSLITAGNLGGWLPKCPH